MSPEVEVLDTDHKVLGMVLSVDGCEFLIPLRTVLEIQKRVIGDVAVIIDGLSITPSMITTIKGIPRSNS